VSAERLRVSRKGASADEPVVLSLKAPRGVVDFTASGIAYTKEEALKCRCGDRCLSCRLDRLLESRPH
jgi:hypothetical protein